MNDENDKPHPHAALMAVYAEVATKTDKPWEHFQFRVCGTRTWQDFNYPQHPAWHVDYEYRRKPRKVKKWVNLYSDPSNLGVLRGYVHHDQIIAAGAKVAQLGLGQDALFVGTVEIEVEE